MGGVDKPVSSGSPGFSQSAGKAGLGVRNNLGKGNCIEPRIPGAGVGLCVGEPYMESVLLTLEAAIKVVFQEGLKDQKTIRFQLMGTWSAWDADWDIFQSCRCSEMKYVNTGQMDFHSLVVPEALPSASMFCGTRTEGCKLKRFGIEDIFTEE